MQWRLTGEGGWAVGVGRSVGVWVGWCVGQLVGVGRSGVRRWVGRSQHGRQGTHLKIDFECVRAQFSRQNPYPTIPARSISLPASHAVCDPPELKRNSLLEPKLDPAAKVSSTVAGSLSKPTTALPDGLCVFMLLWDVILLLACSTTMLRLECGADTSNCADSSQCPQNELRSRSRRRRKVRRDIARATHTNRALCRRTARTWRGRDRRKYAR